MNYTLNIIDKINKIGGVFVILNIKDVCYDIEKIYYENSHIKEKIDKHKRIKISICDLANKYNCIGRMEYRSDYRRKSSEYKTTRGRIDVMWLDKYDNEVLAIKIDSSPRYKSIRKLVLNKCDKIWLYYGDDYEKFEYEKLMEDPEEIINYVLPNMKKDMNMKVINKKEFEALKNIIMELANEPQEIVGVYDKILDLKDKLVEGDYTLTKNQLDELLEYKCRVQKYLSN